MTAGNSAADALLERHRRPPTGPPALKAVATPDPENCSRCHQPATRLIPAYWGAQLCPACCAFTAALYDRSGTWPPVPAVYPTDIDGSAAVRPAEALPDPAVGDGTPRNGQACSNPHSKNLLQTEPAADAMVPGGRPETTP